MPRIHFLLLQGGQHWAVRGQTSFCRALVLRTSTATLKTKQETSPCTHAETSVPSTAFPSRKHIVWHKVEPSGSVNDSNMIAASFLSLHVSLCTWNDICQMVKCDWVVRYHFVYHRVGRERLQMKLKAFSSSDIVRLKYIIFSSVRYLGSFGKIQILNVKVLHFSHKWIMGVN